MATLVNPVAGSVIGTPRGAGSMKRSFTHAWPAPHGFVVETIRGVSPGTDERQHDIIAS